MASGNLRDIKRRIKSVNSTEHITNAMKLVSTAKLRKAKSTFEKTREYFHYITESIEEIFNNTADIPQKYLSGNREIKTTCYVIITSCRGLCGGFNSNVIKVAAKEISKPIIELYDSGEIDEVVIVYTSFVSTMEQQVKTVTLLPFSIENDPEVMKIEKMVDYEPSVEEVFNYLVPKYVEIMIYGAIVESATCEHAARRIAMESATDNARDMLSDLSLFYNRARQASITREICEIVAGSEAQK